MRIAFKFNFRSRATKNTYLIDEPLKDFVKRYLEAYFGERAEVIDKHSYDTLWLKFRDNEVAGAQDLIEIANSKLMDSKEIIGETLADVFKANAQRNIDIGLPQVAKDWDAAKAEDVKYSVNVTSD